MVSPKKSAQALRAAIYTRVSKDKRRGTDREAISVDSQEREAMRVIAEEAWSLVGEAYCDNNFSASPYATKVREDWPRLLTDLEAAVFDVLIIWESSRGSRTLSEWAYFLERVRAMGVLIHVVSHERTYDVRRSRDWKILASDGVEAEHASNETSDRVSRLKAALRAEGRPDGKIPFGWQRHYDPVTRVLLEQLPDPVEAPVVREVIERLHSGEAMIRIAIDFNRRAELEESDPRYVPLRRGRRWRPDHVRRTALNPTHVGKIPRLEHYANPERLPEAEWDPLVSPRYGTGTEEERDAFVEQWEELVRVMNAPERKRSRPGKAKYWLTGLSLCDVCGGVMGVKWNQRGDHNYCCRGVFADGTPTDTSGCASVKMAWADDVVYALLVERLSLPDVMEPATAQDSTVSIAAKAHADQLEASLDEAFEQAVAMNISWEAYAKAEARLKPQIEAALEDSRQGESAVLPVFVPFADQSKGIGRGQARRLVRAMLDDMGVDQRRELVRGVFEWIRIKKGRRGVKVFDPARIVYRWAGCGSHADPGEPCVPECLDSPGPVG